MAADPTPTALAARAATPMSPLWAIVAMTRPSQLVLIGAIYLAGLLLGLTRPGSALEPRSAIMVALLITGAAISAHLVNEAEDVATDRRTGRTRFSGGSGALEASGLRPAVPLWLGLGLAGIVVAGTWTAWLSLALPATAVTLVLAGIVGALVYSLPPLSAMRHGWGEPLNAALGGLVLPLAGVAVVSGRIVALDVLAFLPLTLVVLASVMATAWPDREADAATGKATLQVRLRPTALRSIHAACLAGFVLTTALAAATGAAPFALAGLLVVPLLVVGTLGYTRRTSPLPNVAAMVGLVIVFVAGAAVELADGWER